MQDLYRVEAHFRGDVQGVGFRKFVCETVKPWNVVGFIENRQDGLVYLEIECTKEQFFELLEIVRKKFSVCFYEFEFNDPLRDLKDFKIRN